MKISRLKPLALLAIIFAIVISLSPLIFPAGFLGDLGDPIGQTIPNKFLLTEYLKNGIPPLWNPFSFLGFPLLADIQVGTFYLPDLLIFSIFPPIIAHNISVILHLIFAAIGLYFFAHFNTKNKLLSVTAALTLVLTGSFLTKIVYLNLLETLSYVPWLLILARQAKPKISHIALLFALMIFAGHPIAFLYSLMITFPFIRKYKNFAIALVLSLIITAVQLLPFFELVTHSVRENITYDQFIQGSLTVGDFKNFLTPTPPNINPYDTYIHFGLITFFTFIASLSLLFKKISKSDRRLQIASLILCLAGLALSLGGNLPPLAKILYHLPGFSLVRVPARYIILFHFGAIISIVLFIKYLSKDRKRLGQIITAGVLLNTLLLPSAILQYNSLSKAQENYLPEIKEQIEMQTNTEFSLNSTPKYYLSSSFYLFPNRHVLNFMPNIIGYNPLLLQNFYSKLPVAPVGSFTDPQYFSNHYSTFQNIGINYYIFPNLATLKKEGLEEKAKIEEYLTSANWQKIVKTDQYNIWQNPNPKPFAYFQKSGSEIEDLKFQPGKIELKIKNPLQNTLIVNQAFYPNWQAITDQGDIISAQEYNGLTQTYQIPVDAQKITIRYHATNIYLLLIITVAGSLMLLYYALKND